MMKWPDILFGYWIITEHSESSYNLSHSFAKVIYSIEYTVSAPYFSAFHLFLSILEKDI